MKTISFRSKIICGVSLFFCFQQIGRTEEPVRSHIAKRVIRPVVSIEGKDYSLDDSLPVIKTMLTSPAPAKRDLGLESAANWGERLAGTEVVADVLSLYDLSTNSVDRQKVVVTLAGINDPKCMEFFQRVANSTDEKVKAFALLGLARLDSEVGIPVLIDFLSEANDPDAISQVYKVLNWQTKGEFSSKHQIPLNGTTLERDNFRSEALLWWDENRDRLNNKGGESSEVTVPSTRETD